nr:chromate transporter [uncultured Blautia sp.]
MISEKQSSNRLSLFLTFFKIGLFTFGGGYAMIPLIQREIVDKKGWISDEDILDIVAIAETTPGPIAVNSATFVGYKTGGFLGASFATLGVILPSFLIILGISFVLRKFESLTVIQYAFNGIRAGVLALIIRALLSMYKQCPKNLPSYVLMALSFAGVVFFKINILIVILFCAILGLVFSANEVHVQKKNGRTNP